MIKTPLSVLAAALLLASSHHLAAQPQVVSIQLLNTFDYPTDSYTLLGTGQINDRGTFIAQLVQNPAVFGATGRIDGTFSRPFIEPNDNLNYTSPSGINNHGDVCGRFDGNGSTHGFFRHGTRFRAYDAPVTGVSSTTVDSLNDAGDFTGIYVVSGNPAFAYAHIAGNFITLPIPGILPEATGINNLDEVVGTYGESDGSAFHGFFRAADGTLTLPIDFPGANQTVPLAINDSGYIVGYWTDRIAHAFVIQLPDTFVSYDVPGATGTSFSGINSDGVIVGTYQDQHHITHVLTAQLQVQ